MSRGGREVAKTMNKSRSLSQSQLMWIRFRKHRLAMVGLWIMAALYILAIFAEFWAPYSPLQRFSEYVYCPPQRFHFIDEKGRFHLRPFIYGLKSEFDLEKFATIYKEDKSKKYFLRFFMQGSEYKLIGLFKTNIHFLGVDNGGTMFLLGTDDLGRDLLSRIIHGARISLSIGLVGVFLSLIIGLILGGISGLLGGITDDIIQRIIELLRSIPHIPLWMGISAALPANWSPLRIYFGITIILSSLGWTGIARVVRSKFFSLREEDFVLAAYAAGASEWRIITKHLIPSFISYVIVNVTISIPGMILGETSLSFLGLGLRPPVVSWGVLLQQAQNISAINTYPWLLSPAAFVVISVLAFNFIGDGLRDAADPYSH